MHDLNYISLRPKEINTPVEVTLPSSKSISNRVLIIRALCAEKFPIRNLSHAKDTQDLIRCLESESQELYVGDGGTTLRFLLAYFLITRKLKLITASDSLTSRPLKVLLELLEQLGAEFEYIKEKYSLPLRLKSIQIHDVDILNLDNSISSQYCSSIMLIAPYLNHAIKLRILDKAVSNSYVTLTTKLMQHFGISAEYVDTAWHIPLGTYKSKSFEVEADWSAASFFYSAAALSSNIKIHIKDLIPSDLQADQKITDIIKHWGVSTNYINNTAIISSKINTQVPEEIAIDFLDTPDLFPPLIILCALTKVTLKAQNVQHLRYKESNRLQIFIDFIHRFGGSTSTIRKEGSEQVVFDFSAFDYVEGEFLDTYNDHRIAMAFSLLSFQYEVSIKDHEVVAKSFPDYWNQLRKFILISD
ncbi:MAG: hypothetical protein M3Q56_13260 [Bacteroidota bacterium]|nr:hypothetical protein [Bacteroidota bacterium]